MYILTAELLDEIIVPPRLVCALLVDMIGKSLIVLRI